MEIQSTDRKTYQLMEDGYQLGELIYENLFFLTADIKLANSELYEVKPAGFFGTSIVVTKDGAEIANLKMNWRGHVEYTFQDGQEFVLKPTSMFSYKFTFGKKDEEKLIQFDSKFKWSNFHYTYDITYDKKPQDILFVLLGIYAANYYLATMSGATAGMA